MSPPPRLLIFADNYRAGDPFNSASPRSRHVPEDRFRNLPSFLPSHPSRFLSSVEISIRNRVRGVFSKRKTWFRRATTYRVSIGEKARGGSPKTDRFIPRVYVSISARQPFEESCSSKSSLDRPIIIIVVVFHEFQPCLSTKSISPTRKAMTEEASGSSSSSCPVSRRMPAQILETGFDLLLHAASSTISEGLQNPSTPLRGRERVSFHLAGPSRRESLLVHKAARIPGGARDPEEGFSDEKGERENKLAKYVSRLRRSSLITGLCGVGDTDALARMVTSSRFPLREISPPVSTTSLFTIRNVFSRRTKERNGEGSSLLDGSRLEGRAA